MSTLPLQPTYVVGQDRVRRIVIAAPHWVRELPLQDLELPIRAFSRLTAIGVERVGDLDALTDLDLLAISGFGLRSLREVEHALLAILAEQNKNHLPAYSVSEQLVLASPPSPPSHEDGTGLVGNESPAAKFSRIDTQQSLGAVLEAWLALLPPRSAEIMRARMGWGGSDRTLEDLGQEYGITRERIRQVQKKSLYFLHAHPKLKASLAAALSKLLESRDGPLYIAGLVAEDAWFGQIRHSEQVIPFLIEYLLDRKMFVFELHGRKVVSRLDEDEWLRRIRAARAWLEASVKSRFGLLDCQNAVRALVLGDAPELATELWEKASELCHFVPSVAHPDGVLVAYGRAVEPMVLAILEESDRPLHFTVISERIEARYGERYIRRVHNAAAEIALLLGRGVYGIRKHIAVSRSEERRIVAICEDLILNGPEGRQWHSLELLEELSGEIESIERLNHYSVSALLLQSTRLKYAGRFIWSVGPSRGSPLRPRIDVSEAMLSILREKGTTMTTADIHLELRLLRGLSDTTQIHPRGQLVRVGIAKWGLKDRDLAIPIALMEPLLEELRSILDSRNRALHVSELGKALLHAGAQESWGWDIQGLAQVDPRFRVASGDLLCLSEWTATNRMTLPQVISLAVGEFPDGVTTEELQKWASELMEYSVSTDSVRAVLRAMNAEYDVLKRLWFFVSESGVEEEPQGGGGI
jgi:Sigma-70, region 4/Bacterial RNA polymerase, alpha chain C terminal domain